MQVSGPTGRMLRSLVSIADCLADTQAPHIFTYVITFVCLVVFILKLKADQGQSRTTRLMRSILQDGIPHRDAVFHHRRQGDSISSTR